MDKKELGAAVVELVKAQDDFDKHGWQLMSRREQLRVRVDAAEERLFNVVIEILRNHSQANENKV